MSRVVCVIRFFYPSFFFFTSWSPHLFLYLLSSPVPLSGVSDTTGVVVSVSVTIRTLGYDTTMVSSHLSPPRLHSRVLCILYHTTAFFLFVYLPHNHIKGYAGMTSYGNKVIVRVRRLGGID